tara:strand:- start:1552 stop:1725 length:174 start_codon:yes stop_codon:yes gene_type:complete
MTITKKQEESISKNNKEFFAKQYLKNEKFNKMNEAQKQKAVKLLSDFQAYFNTQLED